MKPARLIDIRTNVLKWSQQKLADELGYARNSVSRMELAKQPIERVAELAVYWLMYRECQIVCNGFPDDDLPGESIDMQHDVAEPPQSLQHNVASGVIIPGDFDSFVRELSFLSSDFADCDSELKHDAFERFNILYSEVSADATIDYIFFWYAGLELKVILNLRSLRAAWRSRSPTA
jgi:transcriptional regulator with XRE-family HTH domain